MDIPETLASSSVPYLRLFSYTYCNYYLFLKRDKGLGMRSKCSKNFDLTRSEIMVNSLIFKVYRLKSKFLYLKSKIFDCFLTLKGQRGRGGRPLRRSCATATDPGRKSAYRPRTKGSRDFASSNDLLDKLPKKQY